MSSHKSALTTLWSLAFILYTTYSASAGWLGPSNYNECVLDNESNRILSPLQTIDIESACEVLFPPEPKEILLDYENRTIQYRDCSGPTGEVKICVTAQPRGYAIHRVVGHFAITSHCTYDQTTFTDVVGSKAWFKDTYSFYIERTFNCSYFSFYGFAR
jgi:hypothetical protein